MACSDGMCGGCDPCLRAQGWDGTDEEDNCEHARIKRRWGGVCCLDCDEILVEPDEDMMRGRY